MEREFKIIIKFSDERPTTSNDVKLYLDDKSIGAVQKVSINAKVDPRHLDFNLDIIHFGSNKEIIQQLKEIFNIKYFDSNDGKYITISNLEYSHKSE